MAPQNSLQKKKRDFLQKRDRLIEKIAKKQEIFIRRDRRALLTEKKTHRSSFLV